MATALLHVTVHGGDMNCYEPNGEKGSFSFMVVYHYWFLSTNDFMAVTNTVISARMLSLPRRTFAPSEDSGAASAGTSAAQRPERRLEDAAPGGAGAEIRPGGWA